MPKGGVRNKKPTQLKVLQGTARSDRMNPKEPKPRPIAPEPPRGMGKYAKEMWRRQAPILERLGLLTEVDGEMFCVLCEAWERYCRSLRQLRQVHKAVKNQEITEAMELIRKAEISVEKAEQSFRLLSNEFGLSPASRSRLSVEVKDDGEGILEKIWTEQSR